MIFREPKRRIRITKSYKGDTYMYSVEFDTHGTRECIVRQYCTDNALKAIVDDDNKHININGYFKISGINGESPKHINRLKVSPTYLVSIKEQLNLD